MNVSSVTTSHVSESIRRTEDEQYEEFLTAIRRRFDAIAKTATALFVTNATGLFDAFLANLPEDRRQHYTCNACRRFVERFGGLVAIDEEGMSIPVMWSGIGVPTFFRASVIATHRLVAKAKVIGVHVSDEKTWGMPSNRSSVEPYEWHHMSVVPPASMVYRSSKLKTVDQRAAELLEEHRMLRHGLGEFSIDVVRQAHALLTSGNLYRSEKCIGVAKWLLDLHERIAGAKGSERRANLVWSAVATAPMGFCHVRSSMIGTLLEDVAASMDPTNFDMTFAEIKRRFDAKMNPMQYMRPAAAPSAGNIAQAEKIVAELRSVGALNRRFAKLEDIQTLWKPMPQPEEPNRGGVFGHLRTKERVQAKSASIEQPPVTMTWEKFVRTVLPDARSIELLVPNHGSFTALVTAVDPNAPPILQWDREERRNPVSWYVYHNGSPASQWNLKSNAYVEVTAIALQPSMWDPERTYAHQGKSVFFLLKGAKDTTYTTGAAFFPETLRLEYHPIRSAMEAYARSSVLAGRDEATACGMKFEENTKRWTCSLRVTNGSGQRMLYVLDRWD